jgi:hypothetical protein
MMFGGGFAQTMINSIKGNRNILPSKRQKFMEDRKIKYTKGAKGKKFQFKEIPENELEKANSLNRIYAKNERRKLLILVLLVSTIIGILMVVFASYMLFD